MARNGEHRRRYGDKEVGLILRRATEFQRQEPASAAEGGGLTLAELEEIAAEAGIDPRHLRRAASELDESGAWLRPEGAARLLGDRSGSRSTGPCRASFRERSSSVSSRISGRRPKVWARRT
jgi:hypothetical protein